MTDLAVDRQTRLSWLLVGALGVLCAVLGFVQYRWIEEVSQAHRERMRNEINGRLQRLRLEFQETVRSVEALQARPSREAGDVREESEAGYIERWRLWREREPHAAMVKRIGVVFPSGDSVHLRLLDTAASEFQDAAWPPEWTGARERFEARIHREGPPPVAGVDSALIEFPRFGGRPPSGGRFAPPQGSARAGEPPRLAEVEWLVVELDQAYLSSRLIPALIRKHFSDDGASLYQSVVVSRRDPKQVLFSTAAGGERALVESASGSITLFDEFRSPGMRPMPGPGDPGAGGRKAGSPPGPPGPGGLGRWLLFVRNEAGSVDTLVARGRWRNHAVSGALFALLLATAWVLIRFTRKAQQLAELQMNFVAGVSHELRTPLAVIGTAAYNLRGKLAGNPAQVSKYGALIESESRKLSAMVEQILQFTALRSGKGVRRSEPVLVEEIIEQGVQANKDLQAGTFELEKRIEPRLPVVLGDPVALRHALQNLLSNAVKYGTEGSNWIGLAASSAETEAGAFVEIRVADHGPGIPAEDQAHIFEPFYRGQYALRDQIHGTGLGLDLVKRIVEAHGGTIRVESAPMQGAAFVMRIPAAPAEYQDEFAHTTG